MRTRTTPFPKQSASKRSENDNGNHEFLRFLPAVETHAAIQFRGLPPADREEAIAEARAAAFLNYESARRNGNSHTVTPGTLARFSVLHVRNGRHFGGSQDSKRDVMSPKAQRAGGFKVRPLGWNNERIYDSMSAPDQPVWRLILLEDRRTPVPDQVAFRMDWSRFLAGQTDRTRTAIAMLAAGHKQAEVADHLGITPPAVCQRMARARREWNLFQGEAVPENSEGQALEPRASTGSKHI